MLRRFISLRAALLVPFVGVVVLVATSISALSYFTGVKAVEPLSEQLLLEIFNFCPKPIANGAFSAKLIAKT